MRCERKLMGWNLRQVGRAHLETERPKVKGARSARVKDHHENNSFGGT